MGEIVIQSCDGLSFLIRNYTLIFFLYKIFLKFGSMKSGYIIIVNP